MRARYLKLTAVMVAGSVLCAGLPAQAPMGTAFTYQGQLKKAGVPVTDKVDFQFTLWNAASGGTQIGSMLSLDDLDVSRGLFVAMLDFGTAAFAGEARWLELAVRGSADPAYTTLSPRQELTPLPYAIHAATAAGGWGSGTALRIPQFAAAGDGTLTNSLLFGSSHGIGVKGAPYWGGTMIGGPDFQVNTGSEPASVWIGDSMKTAGQSIGTLAFVGEATGTMYGKCGYGWIGGEIVTTDPSRGALNFGVAHEPILPDPGPAMRIVFDPSAFRFRVGIGTGYNPPQAELDVFGTVRATGFKMPTGAAAGLVLTSDAAGVGTWQTVGASADWKLTGNAGTVPGTNYVGTTDNQALQLHVNKQRALRLEPNVNGPNLIGGYAGNSVSPGLHSATIAGGGESQWPNQVTGDGGTVGGGRAHTAAEDGTVAGGFHNLAGQMSTVAGGSNNDASGLGATIAGGAGSVANGGSATIGGGGTHMASGERSTIAGGWHNEASGIDSFVGGGQNNVASFEGATVGGGYGNTASGHGATVPGGEINFAVGEHSFAAGLAAQAMHNGAFVWADSTGIPLASWAANQFIARASGGTYIYSNAGATTGVKLLSGGGSWSSVSDRNLKANFAPVDTRQVLERLAAIPIETWNYISQEPAVRHMGPMAQDFHAAFGVGEDDRHISTVDADGVALAAIQGLYELVKEKDAQLAAQQAQIDELTARLARIEARLAGQAGATAGGAR